MLINAIVIYVVVLILSIITLYWRLGITLWSSINVSLILTLVLILTLYPPTNLFKGEQLWLIITYMAIITLTPLIIIIYALTKGIFDFRPDVKEIIPQRDLMAEIIALSK